MFQPLVFYLEFLDLASRLLIDFALSPSVFKACFTQLLEALYPAIDLLVADVMPDGSLTLIAAVFKTIFNDLNAFIFGGFSRCSHTASS